MYLVNSKSILDCETEEETEKHNQEITEIFNKLYKLDNYDCAVLRQYQDKAHKHIKIRVEPTCLHDIDEIWQLGDFKNGIDLLVDGEYFVIVTYGQSYRYKDEQQWRIVTEAFKILPYDDNKNFLDIVSYALGIGPIDKAENQFENICH